MAPSHATGLLTTQSSESVTVRDLLDEPDGRTDLPARTAGAEPRQVDRSGIQVNVRRATVSPATHQIPSTIAVVPCCQP